MISKVHFRFSGLLLNVILIHWPPDAKNWLTGKDPDAGKDWGQEKGTTEDEMVGWHHRLNGHGFGWTLGVGDGQGGLVCCGSQGRSVGHDWVTELILILCKTMWILTTKHIITFQNTKPSLFNQSSCSKTKHAVKYNFSISSLTVFYINPLISLNKPPNFTKS